MAASQVRSTTGKHEIPASTGKVTFIACFMGLVASIGGFMFGYASGQISGISAPSGRASEDMP
jgi:SP family sugar:H+ symporter-like MFS transporter